MDGNKDEALKCLKIGQDALGLGDRARALKFITKAQRLDPSLPVHDLLSTLDPANTSPEPAAGAGDGSAVRRRVPVQVQPTGSGSGTGNDSGTGSGSFTQEQVTIVGEIRRKKDYYDILGLQNSCSVEDVRKAYRKLSLKVHPDKNKAPGSEEAFKKVSKAFQCLSDGEARKQYDLVGPDEAESGGYRRQTRHRANQGFGNGFYYEGDVDAEEIFRNFFFGGVNPRATTQFNFGRGMGARTGQNGSDGLNMRTLVQLLPVIVILLVSFLPSNEPVYSLSRTYGYEHHLVTQKGVPFFVKSRAFEESYPLDSEERMQLEGRIEHEFFSILSHNCRLERQRLHWGYQRHTPNCDTLKKYDAGLVS